MKTDVWMPLYIGDYLRDTLGMRRDEHGSYFLLIMAYWANGGPIPADDEYLREVAKCPPGEWSRTKGIMLRYFKEEGKLWTHKRIDKELVEANESKAKAVNRAKAAAEARWGKEGCLEQSSSNPQAMLNQCPSPSPSPSPSPLPLPSESPSASPVERELSSKSSLGDARGDANIPTWQEVKEFAAVNSITFDNAKTFFDHHEDNGLWLNQFNRIINWKSKIRSWQEKGRTYAQKGKGATLTGADTIVRQKELERAESEIKRIRDQYDSHQDITSKDRDRIKQLKARVTELKTMLGIKI